MIDLGMVAQEICVRQGATVGFNWYASFYFRATRQWYSKQGSAPTDDVAYASAKSWIVNMVREVSMEAE